MQQSLLPLRRINLSVFQRELRPHVPFDGVCFHGRVLTIQGEGFRRQIRLTVFFTPRVNKRQQHIDRHVVRPGLPDQPFAQPRISFPEIITAGPVAVVRSF
jgi:hypothetical protein